MPSCECRFFARLSTDYDYKAKRIEETIAGSRAGLTVTIASIEQCETVRRESDFRVLSCFVALELNVPVDHRIFPNSVSGTCALPCVDRFGVSSAPVRDPGKKLQHQQVSR